MNECLCVSFCSLTAVVLYSFGRPGVDCHVQHDAEFAVIQLLFLVNEVRITVTVT